MPEPSRSRAGKSEARRGRPRVGEVKKTWRKRDQQWRFALRIWWQGERLWVPLGLEADGWNDYRAKLELEAVMREVAAGVWRPPAPPLDPGDRDPSSTSSPPSGSKNTRPTLSAAPTTTIATC